MSAINAAYGVLSDPRRRAAYDARRYLRPVASPAVTAYRPTTKRRPVVVDPPPTASSPTALQRRVDRIVAIVGILLLIAIGFYTVNVIPYAERQLQADRSGITAVRAYRSPEKADAVATAQSASSQPGAEHRAGAAVPGRLASDSGLRSFPGTVLIAPQSLPPFSSLPISRLDATGIGIARYAVYYGDLSSGGAAISGLVGRASFDASAPHMVVCAADSAYCAGQAPGQPSGGIPGFELFRTPNLVRDNPAFVTHRVCCNGVFWSLSWYESQTNMTYTIDLSRSIAALYGSPIIEADVSAAHAVASLAPQLVRLP